MKKIKLFYIYFITLLLVLSTTLTYSFVKYKGIVEITKNFIATKDFYNLKQILLPLEDYELVNIEIYENTNIIFKLRTENKLPYLFFKYKIINFEVFVYYKPFLIIFLTLIQSLIFYLYLKYQSELYEKEKLQSHLFSLSQKLAHDIRSPISTLNIISSKMNDPELKDLQLAVVDKINSIANGLLNESKGQLQSPDNIHQIKSNDKKVQMPQTLNTRPDNTLPLFFQNLTKEYDFKKFAISQKVIFQIQNEDLIRGYLSKSNEHILYQAINNFIQNSIEATDPNFGIIIISSHINLNNQLEIHISDNGKGIPPQILEKLGHSPLSYDKNLDGHSGNGIALFNAKKDLLDIRIQLSIESENTLGTKVILTFSET